MLVEMGKKIRMIDIHSHIIFNIDDGPTSVKESLRMALEAEKTGVETIIATPHYISTSQHQAVPKPKAELQPEVNFQHQTTPHQMEAPQYYAEKYNDQAVESNFNDLSSRLKDCDIELLHGYEVLLDDNTADDVINRNDLTLNRTRYLLLEIPNNKIPKCTKDVLHTLNFNNITPVFAHPERNRCFIRDFTEFISVIETGCLIQVDCASIAGKYGNAVKNFTKKIIKMGLVHCVASDAHCADDYLKWCVPAYNRVKLWTGEKNADSLFHSNPALLLKN